MSAPSDSTWVPTNQKEGTGPAGQAETALAPAEESRDLPPIGRTQVTVANGTEVYWAELGEGDPLLLLHGIGDSHRTWRRVAPLLARHYRVLAPDLPGHGHSGRPDAPYTLDWFSDVMDAWMQAIGVPRAHICGHSYGGGISQWMVMKYRERVNRLALVASGGLGLEVSLGLRLAAIATAERLFTPTAMWLGSRLAVALDPRTFGYPEPAEVAELAHVNALPGSGRAFARTVRGVIDFQGQYMQMCKEVASVHQLPPVALFWGDDDRIIPTSHGLMAVQRFQGATLSIYPDCGHFPHLQAPRRLATELQEFLADAGRNPAQILFACPNGPRSSGPDALPVARCANCTFRERPSWLRATLRLAADDRTGGASR